MTKAINRRFFECFAGVSKPELGKRLAVERSQVTQWEQGKRQIPWFKLKFLADSQGLRWDWIIEGKEPKYRGGRKPQADSVFSPEPFDRLCINARFLSLFAEITQEEIADRLSVTQSAVSSWKQGRRNVPWDKLAFAVRHENVTWEWLLEGRK